MKIILSTRNPSKAEQIKAIFSGSSFTILTLDDAGIVGEGIEDGVSLEENAFKKAFFSHHQSKGEWTMADDTGLFINHLNGEPGIKAARWAGENASTDEITTYTLKKLKGALDRSARFETVVALISPGGKAYYFSGKIRGIILESPKTKPQPKMPYSGIFMPDQTNKVWAEMTVEEENLISHRGKAFREVRAFLESIHEK
jgi:XTP/dITP diphosphohydrolase